MTDSIRHNPLNDLVIDSVEMLRRSDQKIQSILQRIELRQNKPSHKFDDTMRLISLRCVEHRDVQDEAQD